MGPQILTLRGIREELQGEKIQISQQLVIHPRMDCREYFKQIMPGCSVQRRKAAHILGVDTVENNR
ncbi:MAG: hypothetical protein LBG24_04305 [Treponema sp.]|jgi:hypothetical protein|nr:hypothetical protein [Treponema sp.]